MDVVRSTHVQRWHLDGGPPILIELELATVEGNSLGQVAALLSPALADELGVALQTHAALDFDKAPDPLTGPDPRDVEQLTALLDLVESFPSNEQRARYLLTCNWLRERGAAAAALNAEQLDRLRSGNVSVGS